MGDTTNRLAGTAYVTIDGVTVMVAGQFKYSPSKVERSTLTGMDSVHGYKEKPRAPFISYQARDSSSTSIARINNSTDVTVVVELANGKTVIGENMWSVNTQDVDSEEAVFDVRWEGGSVTEYCIDMATLDKKKTIVLSKALTMGDVRYEHLDLKEPVLAEVE